MPSGYYIEVKLSLIFLLLFSGLVGSAQQADPKFHLYLMAGQSNMAGRAPIDSEALLTDPRIFMLDKEGAWVPAKDPVHFDKPSVAGVGPAISFAKAMLSRETDSNVRIGLIPCAWGGSGIQVWQPDSPYLNGHPYDDAIARTQLAVRSGVLKGILWHQGETDNNAVGATLYLQRLTVLVARFRRAFSNDQLPFVAGEIGYFAKSTLINRTIDQVPLKISYAAVVSAAGLTDKGDHTHFDTRSARELGTRYAAAMYQLQQNNHNE